MENENLQMVEENNGITLKDLLFILKRNVILITIVTVVITIIGIIYGFGFKSYTYATNVTFMVRTNNQSTTSSIYSDTSQALRMVNTIKEFIMDDLVLEQTAKELTPFATSDEKYESSVKAIKSSLKNGISFSNSEDSLIVKVTMKSTIYQLENSDNVFVVDAANTLITEAQRISKLYATDENGNYETGNTGDKQYKYQYIANNIQELSWAKEYSASRGATLVVAICFIVGFVLGYLTALIRYLLDDTLKTKEELEQITGVPVLAKIEPIKSL